MENAEYNKDRILQSLIETRDNNQSTINEIKQVQSYLPYIQKGNELIHSEIEALKQVPADRFYNLPQETFLLIEANKSTSQQIYGQVHKFSPLLVGTTSSATYSGILSVYNWLDSERVETFDVGVEKAAKDLKKVIYDDKTKSDLKVEIRALLAKLLRPENNKYDLIIEEIRQAKIGQRNVENVALPMRTLLEKIKGDLKTRLPNQVGVSKNEILPNVATQLIDPFKKSPAYQAFVVLIGKFDDLHHKLTNVGKWNIKDTDGIDKLEIEYDTVIYSLLLPLKDKL